MPFASRLIGDFIYGDSYSPGKRFIFGAFTYLFGKGALSFIRKYKYRNFLRARKVKGFIGTGCNFIILYNIPILSK